MFIALPWLIFGDETTYAILNGWETIGVFCLVLEGVSGTAINHASVLQAWCFPRMHKTAGGGRLDFDSQPSQINEQWLSQLTTASHLPFVFSVTEFPLPIWHPSLACEGWMAPTYICNCIKKNTELFLFLNMWPTCLANLHTISGVKDFLIIR